MVEELLWIPRFEETPNNLDLLLEVVLYMEEEINDLMDIADSELLTDNYEQNC